MFDNIQRTEPTEKQISRLVTSLEKFGGFDGGDPTRTDRLNIAEWLLNRGVEVNLAPASQPLSR